MSTKSEMSGLLKIAGEKKGLLIAASIFSVLSSLLQIAPFVAVYKIVEELLRNAQSPAGIDRELVVYWGVVAFLALVGALLALYVGLMCSHVAAFQILYQLRVRLAEHVAAGDQRAGQKQNGHPVAHRLKTSQNADKIIVLDQGRLAEEGTHSELVARAGLYANLWSLQQEAEGWRVK